MVYMEPEELKVKLFKVPALSLAQTENLHFRDFRKSRTEDGYFLERILSLSGLKVGDLAAGKHFVLSLVPLT